VKRRLTQLFLSSSLVWLVAAYPVRRLGGDQLLVFSLVALILCLVPTTLTLAWGTWAMQQSAEQQLLLLVGGTAMRMGVALGFGLGMYLIFPYFQDKRFWLCLLAAYMVTLGLEMMLLLGPLTAANGKGAGT
jgi:hypothetical protein